jgi:hypothetical protein
MSVLDQVSVLASDHSQAVSSIGVLQEKIGKPFSDQWSITNLSLVFEHKRKCSPSSPSLSHLAL